MRLLLVEDEASLASKIKERLTTEGYVVDWAADGEEGLHFGLDYPIDLAIVDIGLPKLDGINLTKQLREKSKDYPVLILTARGNWQDKVEGLEAGADDYLVKPFHEEELLARLHALLRRSAGRAQNIIQLGPIDVNTSEKQVYLSGEAINLTAYEYRVLEYLSLNPTKIISKLELTEHIYEDEAEHDSNVIEVFVRRLRKKLDPNSTLKPIETIRGQGYRINSL